MPTLDWIGKDAVTEHHKEVPFKILSHREELSFGEKDTGNMIVEGDNLEALKALLPYYKGKVKCIYIDPPYNTGKENWSYNDNVNSPQMKEWLGKLVNDEDLSRHDKWLCMMYPRLLLLSEFLRDDGVIFISIDDNEINNLLHIANDIFHEKNRLGILIWDLGTGTTAGHFTRAHEYIVTYAKDKARLSNFSNISEGEKIIHGALKKPSKANPFSKIEFPAGMEYEGVNAVFEGQIGGSEKINIISEKMVFENGKLKYPVVLEAGWGMRNQVLSWLAGNETYDSKGQRVTKFFFNKNGILWYEKEKDVINPKTVLSKLGSTKNGSTVLFDIMKEKVFDFPKPIELLSFLFKLTTDKNAIVLDSFSGSGTTAHAVLDLNRQDSGNRRFILIEMEKEICQNITSERIRRVIKGYGDTEGLGGGFDYYQLGETLFDEHGKIRETITFSELARHVFFAETGTPLEKKESSTTPLLGTKQGLAVYLLYNGILKDKTPNRGNVLTRDVLQNLPHHDGAKVIYGTSCRLSQKTLRENNITFKQIPYEIKIS